MYNKLYFLNSQSKKIPEYSLGFNLVFKIKPGLCNVNTRSRLFPGLSKNEVYLFINIFFFHDLHETKKRNNFKPSIFKVKLKTKPKSEQTKAKIKQLKVNRFSHNTLQKLLNPVQKKS